MAIILENTLLNNFAVKSLIVSLRRRLGDLNPKKYLFAEFPDEYRWTDDELLDYLCDALNDINYTTPHTNWTLENIPLVSLLKDGAVIFAIIRQLIYHAGEKFSYSDNGLSLNLDKYISYNTALQSLYNAYEQKKRMLKLSFRPSAIGLGSQRLPFQIQRPLGMLPNMKNIFGI